VLDLGTESGILSIAAALQGADNILAPEIDPVGVLTAQKNVGLNAVERVVKVRRGSIEEARNSSTETGGFDLVMVNILNPVILSFLDAGLAGVLKPRAMLVTSGIERVEVPRVELALHSAWIANHVVRTLDGWATVSCRQPETWKKQR
jgi:ribosomal protein L11 methyltransferase